MAKMISDILDTNRVDFKYLLDSWESKSGRQSHDLRLYSEMRSRAIQAVKELGLDPTDTISGELYFALQERAKLDNKWLEAYLNINDSDDPKEVLERISKWVLKNSNSAEVWVCKQAKVKGFLKKNPPKNLMKSIGVRSIDSLLKRSSATEVLALAYEVESDEWKSKYRQNYKKIKVSDFDVSKIDIKIVDRPKVDKLVKSGLNDSKMIIPCAETGGILILQPKARFPLDVIAILSSLAECISDLRRHGALYRTLSVYKDFGVKFHDISSKGLVGATVSEYEIGWNSIHRHLVGNEDFFGSVEQPYITYDEFTHQPAVELLAQHDDRFNFWNNLQYAFYTDKDQNHVSMNLIDVVTNSINRSPYLKSTKNYGKSRLWEELWSRYLLHDHVADDVIGKFLNN